MELAEHNHVASDIKLPGECPACDAYWQNKVDSPNGGESRNGGEPPNWEEYAATAALDAEERTTLARELSAAGHEGCAVDLQEADDPDVAETAYAIAEHVREACGDITADPDLAARLVAWADAHEAMPPEVPRKRTMTVLTHREGNMLVIEMATDDFLDLTIGDDTIMVVNVAHDGRPMFSFHKMGQMEVTRDDLEPPA